MDPKTVEWASHEIFKLINCVQSYPVLYNNINYNSNRAITDKLWQVIAQKIPNKTAQNCKNKWRYLRKGFSERFDSDRLVKWPYYGQLAFLSPFINNNGATMLNRSVRIIPQPSTSTSTSISDDQSRSMIRVKDRKSLMPESKKRPREAVVVPMNQTNLPNEPNTKKSTIGILFERIEKDILNLPAHEQYDFEIQVMTIFRDKLKNNGTNGNR